jgi:hypothetical protein
MSDGPSGGRGKWSQAGVPHKGWTCINYEDLGKPSMRCEMCESSEIRYVHYMQHPHYSGVLSCGVICAGHMEQDLVQAAGREKKLKGNARRRANFPNRKKWYVNRNGRPQIKIRAFTITMFHKPNGWGGVVNHPRLTNGVFTRERFPDLATAQRAAFDTLTFLEDTV